MMKREKWADLAKGVGIILVIFGHIKYTYEPFRIWLYSFHMPLFFFISGYFVKRKNGLGKDILHKAYTLLVPYIILNFIWYGMEYVLRWITGNPIKIFDLDKFIGLFIQLPPDSKYESTAWFFGALFVSTVLLLIIIYITKNRQKNIIIVTTFLTILGVILVKTTTIRIFWNIEVALLMMLFIGCGYLVKEHKIIGKYNNLNTYIKIILIIIFGCLGGIFCYLNYNMSNNGYIDYYLRRINNSITCYCAGIFNILFIVCLCNIISSNKRKINLDDLESIGKNSAIYYVLTANSIHVGYAFINIFNLIQLSRWEKAIFTFIIALVVPIPVIAILNRFFPVLIGKNIKNGVAYEKK